MPCYVEGGGCANLWAAFGADRWAWFIGKKFTFFRRKTPFGGRKLQDDPSAQADISGLMSVVEEQKTFAKRRETGKE
jgi:hypothetical protein